MTPDWLPINEVPELAKYSDFSLLTEGGFGQIFLAQRSDANSQERVLFKRLRPMRISDPKQRELFTREAQFLKQLHHDQIPKFFEGFLSETECFFIMEYLPGIDLGTLLQNARASGTRPSITFILEMGIQVCKVLDYLHHFRNPEHELDPILHCDIKPHNLLLRQTGKLILLDFSVAQHLKEDRPDVGGSPLYLPPERIGKQDITVQADLFPLTLSLYFLMTHRTLAKGDTWAQILGFYLQEMYVPAIKNQNFPKPLEEFFLKNLQLKPEKRAPDARSLQGEILDLFSALKLDRDPVALQKEIKALSQIS